MSGYLTLFFALLLLNLSCKEKATAPDSADMQLSWKGTLSIGEPSGITWNADYTGYYIAGGKDGKVFLTDTAGNVLKTLSYNADDIEGVTFNRKDSTLWITEERSRTIVNLSLTGRELTRFTIAAQRGPINKGLEGVTTNNTGNLIVVNEKSPAQFIVLDSNGYIVSSAEIPFASDLSDIAFNNSTGDYYIVSDESEAFFIWNPQAGLKAKFTLPRNKYEGITVNPNKRTVTLVNDEDRSILVYRY